MTPPENCKMKYKDFTQAIKLCIEAGVGCFVAKADMKSAFRNLPIKPVDWQLLVMKAYHPRTDQVFILWISAYLLGQASLALTFRDSQMQLSLYSEKEQERRPIIIWMTSFSTALLKLPCD